MKNAEIDWSKAPEWATVRLQNRHDTTLFAWAERYEEDARFIRGDATSIAFTCLAVNSWDVIASRPQSWNGEGLPPVGVFVSFCGNTGAFYPTREWLEGDELEVVAHRKVCGETTALVFNTRTQHATGLHTAYYRPRASTRTPEQLAAEARKAAIDEMYQIFKDSPGLAAQQGMAALYDAGYRKTKTCDPVESDK